MPDLSTQHPYYAEMANHWREAWDFWRGGNCVLEPGRQVSKYGFLLGAPLSDGGDTGGEVGEARRRERSRFERVSPQSYIWPHANESVDGYQDRRARAVHYPLLRHVADTYTSAAFRRPPKRGDHGDPWETFWRDVDLQGTDIDAFISQAAGVGLCFGLCFGVVDKPMVDRAATSRADQLARNERAYVSLYTPLDVINWSVDDLGQLNWIVLCERAPDTRSPGDEFDDAAPRRYKVWYRDRWELYEEVISDSRATADFALHSEGAHPVGEVPVSMLYARRGTDIREPLRADSMLSGLVRIDRGLLNDMSVLQEVIIKQGFAQLMIPEDDGGAPGPITIGPGTYVGFNGAAGSPVMLAPDAALILAHLKAAEFRLQMAKELVGVGRGKSEYSKEERSAEALMVESRNEHNRIVTLVDAAQEFEGGINRHVAAWEGAADVPDVKYNRDVSLRGLSRQLQDVLSLKTIGLPIEMLKGLIAPVAAQLLEEMGQSESDIKDVLSAIDAMDAPEPVPTSANTSANDDQSDGNGG